MRRIVSLAVIGVIVAGSWSVALAENRGWFGKGDRVKGSGTLVTQTRDLETFSSIEASGAFDIEITVGEPQSVTITFDDNLIDRVTADVRRGTLRLGSEGSYLSKHACVVVITVPALDGFESTGSGDVRIENLIADTFECRLTGSGSIYALGSVDELDLEISGSGDIDARDLKARDVYARVSGSGNIDVHALESISGRVSGSGDIYYYGDPKHTNVRVSGSGTIRRR